ncbi:MAG: glucose-1-phosphate adenylyltransferase [Candidatus Latescibacterota bacterium]
MPVPHASRWLNDTLALVLAGGKGQRLYPLTRDRTKAAVPFGGMYRLIDFTLSNCLHSGVRRIAVLPQYKYGSLERHLRLGWDFLKPEVGGSLAVVPPQQHVHDGWYRGTADAVFQNTCTLREEHPSQTLILSSDHVYRMDYGRLLDYHLHKGAGLTIACVEVDLEEAGRFGVVGAAVDGRVVSFAEKPLNPHALPGKPGRALVSMGVYIFDTDLLVDCLDADAREEDSSHDFGHDVISHLVTRRERVYAYNTYQEIGADFYWRDIGVIDAYWEASMELLRPDTPFDLLDPDWPIHTYYPPLPPARILQEDELDSEAANSLVCPGSRLADARVHRSIVSPGVVIDRHAEVVDSVVMDGARIGAGARIERCIVDKNARIPAGCRLGADPESEQRVLHVSPGGTVVVPRGTDLARHMREAQHAYSFYSNGYVPRPDRPPARRVGPVRALDWLQVSPEVEDPEQAHDHRLQRAV